VGYLSIIPLDIDIVTTPEEFLSLETDWIVLSKTTASPSLFSTWEWVVNWWDIYLSHRSHQLCVFVFYDKKAIVGMVPFFCLDHERLLDKIQRCREFRNFGSKIDNQETATEEPIFLVRAGYEDAVHEALVAYLVKQKDAKWDYVVFTMAYVASEDPDIRLRYRKGNKLCATKSQLGSEVRHLPTDWAAFKKTLSRSMRDNLPYYPRLLERDGHHAEVRFLTTPEEVAAGIDPLIYLHRCRAENESTQVAHFDHLANTDTVRFIKTIFPILAASSQLFLVNLDIDGDLVASQAFFICDDNITFYYSGFMSAFSKYSPLFIIATHAIRYAIDNKISKINFLPGVAAWKTRWGAQSTYYRKETRINRLHPFSFQRTLMSFWRRQRVEAKKRK
jgi:hypothetical protein